MATKKKAKQAQATSARFEKGLRETLAQVSIRELFASVHELSQLIAIVAETDKAQTALLANHTARLEALEANSVRQSSDVDLGRYWGTT